MISGSVNHIYKPESEVNEVSQGKYNNYNKEVTRITTTNIRIIIMVKRIGTKTTRVPIRRKMSKRNPRTRMSTLH